MEFRVVGAMGRDRSTPPQFLQLPAITPLGPSTTTRPLALVEEMSAFFEEAPAAALLGTVDGDPASGLVPTTPMMWMEPVRENPSVGDTETWEFYNATGDAHPMHIHEVLFEVVNRQAILVEEEVHGCRSSPVRAPTPGAVGGRLEGHGDRLSGRGHPGQDEVRERGPVRLALPHRVPRGQRDDAAVPDRPVQEDNPAQPG